MPVKSLPVEKYNCHNFVGSEESHIVDVTVSSRCQLDAFGSGRHEFGEMCECIEHGLFVEFVGCRVDNNGRIQIIVEVGWSSDGVEGKVPVDQSTHPVVDNLSQNIQGLSYAN